LDRAAAGSATAASSETTGAGTIPTNSVTFSEVISVSASTTAAITNRGSPSASPSARRLIAIVGARIATSTTGSAGIAIAIAPSLADPIRI
jgi:hypothetical protein